MNIILYGKYSSFFVIFFKLILRVNNEWVKEVTIEMLCFIAGTLVLTSLDLKKIEEIKAGDKVWSYNEKTKKRIKNS